MTFGKLLQKARKKANLTTKQVADTVGASRQYIEKLEADEHTPGLDLVRRLHVALDMDPVAILRSK